MRTRDFYLLLKSYEIDFFTGVPCSFLKNIINEILKDKSATYVQAVREDAAIAIAAGAYFASRVPAVFMPNSGLGHCFDVLTSLNLVYEIPVLLLISWRGHKEPNVPQHYIIGNVTLNLLRDINIPACVLEGNSVKESLHGLLNQMKKNKTPVVALLKRGIFNDED